VPDIRFELDPKFIENIHKASNKSASSLKPVIDAVRSATDEVYVRARESLAREAGKAEAEVQAAKSNPRRFSKSNRDSFAYAKAKAGAIRAGRNTIAPTMEYDGTEIFGRVTIFRKGSSVLEYGGIDSSFEIGKGTGRYVEHPAYAFLRRALDGMG
jgi:hypothetical protein